MQCHFAKANPVNGIHLHRLPQSVYCSESVAKNTSHVSRRYPLAIYMFQGKITAVQFVNDLGSENH